ncbi:MAG: hypothetical protein AUJ71_03420 [Candidatus Omnitrophica bacterium CG1_02_49_16]|nr:MAG: hypothetical protein AUJ71_03420 [Candidatus Omnitrophica bacterium CG1_02_49_16]
MDWPVRYNNFVKKSAIGVDIGGTSVKLGLVSLEGRVLYRETFLTASAQGSQAMLHLLASRLVGLIRRAKTMRVNVRGIGIGAPGPIDVKRGLVYFFPNIPGWKNTPLRAFLEGRLKLPVWIDNDASVMALAEFRFGAGRKTKNMIALTLGTGVGGGIILDGKLFHGVSYSAAEIGHIVLNENGPRCGCGSRGCIETYVGNGYFARAVKKHLKAGRKGLLNRWVFKDGKELTPLLVWQAAKANDPLALEMWRKTGAHLGTALAGLVNILNPERIVLGGGIAQNNKFLLSAAVRTIKKKAFPIASHSVKVVPAALGVDAGLIGAAALTF